LGGGRSPPSKHEEKWLYSKERARQSEMAETLDTYWLGAGAHQSTYEALVARYTTVEGACLRDSVGLMLRAERLYRRAHLRGADAGEARAHLRAIVRAAAAAPHALLAEALAHLEPDGADLAALERAFDALVRYADAGERPRAFTLDLAPARAPAQAPRVHIAAAPELLSPRRARAYTLDDVEAQLAGGATARLASSYLRGGGREQQAFEKMVVLASLFDAGAKIYERADVLPEMALFWLAFQLMRAAHLFAPVLPDAAYARLMTACVARAKTRDPAHDRARLRAVLAEIDACASVLASKKSDAQPRIGRLRESLERLMTLVLQVAEVPLRLPVREQNGEPSRLPEIVERYAAAHTAAGSDSRRRLYDYCAAQPRPVVISAPHDAELALFHLANDILTGAALRPPRFAATAAQMCARRDSILTWLRAPRWSLHCLDDALRAIKTLDAVPDERNANAATRIKKARERAEERVRDLAAAAIAEALENAFPSGSLSPRHPKRPLLERILGK
jgi:hypothetical protein